MSPRVATVGADNGGSCFAVLVSRVVCALVACAPSSARHTTSMGKCEQQQYSSGNWTRLCSGCPAMPALFVNEFDFKDTVQNGAGGKGEYFVEFIYDTTATASSTYVPSYELLFIDENGTSVTVPLDSAGMTRTPDPSTTKRVYYTRDIPRSLLQAKVDPDRFSLAVCCTAAATKAQCYGTDEAPRVLQFISYGHNTNVTGPNGSCVEGVQSQLIKVKDTATRHQGGSSPKEFENVLGLRGTSEAMEHVDLRDLTWEEFYLESKGAANYGCCNASNVCQENGVTNVFWGKSGTCVKDSHGTITKRPDPSGCPKQCEQRFVPNRKSFCDNIGVQLSDHLGGSASMTNRTACTTVRDRLDDGASCALRCTSGDLRAVSTSPTGALKQPTCDHGCLQMSFQCVSTVVGACTATSCGTASQGTCRNGIAPATHWCTCNAQYQGGECQTLITASPTSSPTANPTNKKVDQACQMGTCRCQTTAQSAATKLNHGHAWSRNTSVGAPCNGSNADETKDMVVTCTGMQYSESATTCYPLSTARCWEQDPTARLPRKPHTNYESTPLWKDGSVWHAPLCFPLHTCANNSGAFQTGEYEVRQDLKYLDRNCTKRSAACLGSEYPNPPPTRYSDRGRCTRRHVVCDTASIGGVCKPQVHGCTQSRTLLAANTDFSDSYTQGLEILTSGDRNKDVKRKFTFTAADQDDGTRDVSFCDCGYYPGSPWNGTFYEASAPNVTHDIVCKQRSAACRSNTQYAVEMGNRTHDLVCKDVTPCPLGMRRSVPARSCLYDTGKTPQMNARRAALCLSEPNKKPRDAGCNWSADFGGNRAYSTSGPSSPVKNGAKSTTLVKLLINCSIMSALKTEGCFYPTSNGMEDGSTAARVPVNNECAFKDDFRSWMMARLNLSEPRLVSIEGGMGGTGFVYSCDKNCIHYETCFLLARVPGSADAGVVAMVNNVSSGGTLFIPLATAADNAKTGAVFAAGWLLNGENSVSRVQYIVPPPPPPPPLPSHAVRNGILLFVCIMLIGLLGFAAWWNKRKLKKKIGDVKDAGNRIVHGQIKAKIKKDMRTPVTQEIEMSVL